MFGSRRRLEARCAAADANADAASTGERLSRIAAMRARGSGGDSKTFLSLMPNAPGAKCSPSRKSTCGATPTTTLPRVEHAAWMRFSDKSMEGVTEMIAARRWVERIAAAGGWAAYKKARPASLARIFEPKFPLLPAEIIPIIVEFSFRKY